MRKLIAGMKISVDGKIEGPEHGAEPRRNVVVGLNYERSSSFKVDV